MASSAPSRPMPASPSPLDAADFARRMFDENGDALMLVDPETDAILDANQTMVRLSGFSRPELVGAQVLDLFKLDTVASKGDSLLRNATNKTTVFHGRGGFLLYVKRDPGWMAVTVTITRIHAASGTLALYTVRDDSDRRQALARAVQAEQEVRKSEARFRALVEKSSDVELIINHHGIVTYSSPSIERLLGHPISHVVGRSAYRFVHEDHQPELRSKLLQLTATPGGEVSHVVLLTHADGTFRHVDLMAVNRLDDPSVGGLVLNYRDVTERVDAEQKVRHQNAILHALFNGIPDAIFRIDAAGQCVGGNTAFETLFGGPVTELLGKRCSQLTTNGWGGRADEIVDQVLRTGAADHREDWLRTADGRDVLLDTVFSPIEADGRVIGLVAVGRDVTARKRLEDQLRESQKLEAVGQLAGGVAHDFNNLLTVVSGNLELLREMHNGDVTDELLKPTEKAARRASELVSQLLGFARRSPLRRRVVTGNDLVTETVTLLRHGLDPRIRLVPQLRPQRWSVFVDPGQMNQVLMNLCLNARDAMPHGGTLWLTTGNITVTTDDAAADPLKRPGDFVRIRVRDTGMGIPEDIRNKVFDPFFTTKDVGQGTGLGLAVAFGIVQSHDGWIECSSETGAGTIFDVYLPRHPDIASPVEATPQSTPSPVGRGERVLVADDEPLVRNFARMVLSKLGYQVTVVDDGRQAVQAVSTARPPFDVIILDLTMPTLGGFDALREIRPMAPTVPVIIASDYSADRADSGLRLTNTSFLDKPYLPTALGKAVRQALDRTP